MARLQLDRAWISNPLDLSTSVKCGTNDRQQVTINDSEVRAYANNRRRSISSPKKMRTIKVRLTLISKADLRWLEQHAGQIIRYRDKWGFAIYGTYAQVEARPYRSGDWDATIAITEVSYLESVHG